jgi:predicted esterase
VHGAVAAAMATVVAGGVGGAVAGVAALVAALAWPARLPAQQAAQQASAAAPAVTRADLAAAYLRLDRVVAAQPPDDSARVAVNRAFDQSTLAFFAGRFAQAVRTIDSLTTALTGTPPAPSRPPARVVDGGPPSRVRDALLARLARLDSAGPLRQAIVSATARASLLVDVASPERGAEFLADPAVLAPAVAAEVAALERGRTPYARLAGDHWRALRGAAGTLVPFRVVAPPPVAASRAPVPVIIALHGAGGDENMFVDAYGAGAVARLAAAQGALLVSPATTAFMQSLEHFDGLLAQLASEYAVDTTRVYVVGHSMGAGAAARLAQQRGARLAAVACLAGGAPVTAPDAPPVLFVGAALDPIIPAATVERAAAASREAGTRATYRVMPLDGHTLMVGPALADAVPWLFTHRR